MASGRAWKFHALPINADGGQMSEEVIKRGESDQTEQSGGIIGPQELSWGGERWGKECTIKSEGCRRKLQTYGCAADYRMAAKGPGLSPATAEPNTLVSSLAPNNRPDGAKGERNETRGG